MRDRNRWLSISSQPAKQTKTHSYQYLHGGGCINDTVVHLDAYLPFGGVGESGMKLPRQSQLDTFSHKKSIMKKSNLIDIPLRYPPYPESTKLLKKFMK